MLKSFTLSADFAELEFDCGHAIRACPPGLAELYKLQGKLEDITCLVCEALYKRKSELEGIQQLKDMGVWRGTIEEI